MTHYDAIVIGTGQAGPYVASRLAGAGMKVAVVERSLIGGTCVNTGCIPTKTMVASAYAGADEPYLFGRVRVAGADAARGSYRSFASFKDPDGNGWLFQEVTQRLEGRIDPATTTFASVSDLASAFRRAERAHGVYETRLGKGRDENWADWYAAYMVAEQSGAKLPE